MNEKKINQNYFFLPRESALWSGGKGQAKMVPRLKPHLFKGVTN